MITIRKDDSSTFGENIGRITGYYSTGGDYLNTHNFSSPNTLVNGQTVQEPGTEVSQEEKTDFYMRNGYQAGELFNLTFDTNGKVELPSLRDFKGTVIDLNQYILTSSVYDFGGWYSDPEMTHPIDTVVLNENITVYAKFTIKSFQLTFNTN